ncbi:hypothetical protein [Citrobacter amalonaticus]|uniref:hypothetical protein n=1 Tax=Citrobacter amalonaticus TaxID=35703 RepID=UPI0015A503EF|nr:hypothetical protein [Citrobacter amalonaticus]
MKQLIECEISDFFAGFGHPGEPETPEEMQSQLLTRVMPLLAGMEQEPVAYMHRNGVSLMYAGDLDAKFKVKQSGWSPLYAAPQLPQPAVVDADDNFYSWFGREWHENYQHNQYTTAAKQMLGVMAESAWRAGRRAAMLQGADGTLTNEDTRNHPEDNLDMVDHSGDANEKGNSPVIPEGWVMVPIEPTEDMIVNGFESEPDESFSDEKEWEVYDDMSGCQQAAHRAKLCWAAMIAAAPKLE